MTANAPQFALMASSRKESSASLALRTVLNALLAINAKFAKPASLFKTESALTNATQDIFFSTILAKDVTIQDAKPVLLIKQHARAAPLLTNLETETALLTVMFLSSSINLLTAAKTAK